MTRSNKGKPLPTNQWGPLLFVLPLLLASLFSGGCVHRAPEVRSRGFEEVVTTEEALEEGYAPQRWALVVGIDRYQDPAFTPLRHATSDARAISEVLKDERHGGFDRVITLTRNGEVARDDILFELRRLRFDLRRQDTFVFYFSGHGTLETNPAGDHHLYLVASDTRLSNLPGTAIDIESLRTFLSRLKPQRKAMILDNCFAGQGKSRVSATARAELEHDAVPWDELARTFGQSEAILMASTLGGAAREDDSLGHGVYTYYLVAGLSNDRPLADANRDGAVSTYELHDYARARTMEFTKNAQIPEGFFRMIGRAEIYVAGRPDPALESQSALVYSYRADGTVAEGAAAALEVDGRSKGSFPQTVAVAPGRREVSVRDSQGRVMARGRLDFAPGQVYPIELLMEELQGYRRYFALRSGAGLAVFGEAAGVWGDVLPGVELISGYRVRGGRLRGLSLAFHLGLNPALEGDWASLPESSQSLESAPSSESVQRVRTIPELGASVMIRRSLRRFQGGMGWQGAVRYVPEVDLASASSADTPSLSRAAQNWLVIQGGPVLWQGYALDPHLLLTLEESISWFSAKIQSPDVRSQNAEIGLKIGLELGF